MRSALNLAGRIALLLGLYLVLEWWIESASHLPEKSYRESWFFVELFGHPMAIFLLLCVVASFLLAQNRTLWQTWASFENARAIRSFVFSVVIVLSWSFSAYPTNWYFGQLHGCDRLLLLVLTALVWWKPVFLFPYLLVLASIRWQFSYPLEAGYLMAEFKPLINVLILFCSTQFLSVMTCRRNTSEFCVFILLSHRLQISGCPAWESYCLTGSRTDIPTLLCTTRMPTVGSHGWSQRLGSRLHRL